VVFEIRSKTPLEKDPQGLLEDRGVKICDFGGVIYLGSPVFAILCSLLQQII